jgi:hypothetical protein
MQLRSVRVGDVLPDAERSGFCGHPDGYIDRDPGIRPSVRQYVAYAAPWEPIPDHGLTRHAESRHD